MIRHIVTWKLLAADDRSRDSAAGEIARTLEALPAVIPEIRALTVARNMAYLDKNHDVVLIADFDSVEALDAYQVHPAHVHAGGIVGALVSARASVDFEL